MRIQFMTMIATVLATAPAALGHPAGHAHLHSPTGWTSGAVIGIAAVVVGAAALLFRRCGQRRR